MSLERLNFLLNRAMDRELTFQTAREQAVALTEVQKKQLEELRARSEKSEPGVFDTVQHNPANTEFELRDAQALLLQAALLEKAGIASAHVNPQQVQAYYQQHQADYGPLPAEPALRQAAWEGIDQEIRNKLAPQLEAEYQQKFQQYFQQLRAAAKIATAPSGS